MIMARKRKKDDVSIYRPLLPQLSNTLENIFYVNFMSSNIFINSQDDSREKKLRYYA